MRRRVGEARVARLATVRPDGAPHVIPLVFALDGDTIYSSVDEKPKKSRDLKRLENIRANPRVELLVDGYEEDWDRVWWVRVLGSARVVEEGPERDRGLVLLAEKYPQYEDMPPQGAAVIIDVDRWRSWSAE